MLVQQLAGGTMKRGQLPVYLAAELLAGALAAVAFATVSRTRADATASEPVTQTTEVRGRDLRPGPVHP